MSCVDGSLDAPLIYYVSISLECLAGRGGNKVQNLLARRAGIKAAAAASLIGTPGSYQDKLVGFDQALRVFGRSIRSACR